MRNAEKHGDEAAEFLEKYRIGGAPPGSPPSDLKGFNWGAFLLTYVWVLAHQMYLWCVLLFAIASLGILIFWLRPWFWPLAILILKILDFGISLYLGFKGNRLAWENRAWTDASEFRETQIVWRNWGIAVVIVECVVTIVRWILPATS